jgi:hypothetical protein
MRLVELGEIAPERVDLHGKRVLIFIVAYNAETTIQKVLARIPESLHTDGVRC